MVSILNEYIEFGFCFKHSAFLELLQIRPNLSLPKVTLILTLNFELLSCFENFWIRTCVTDVSTMDCYDF